MTKSNKTIFIVLVCAFIALFAVAIFVQAPVANAQDKPRFVVKTQDGQSWELYLDGAKLDYACASGSFIDIVNPDKAYSIVLYKAIKKELVARGIIGEDIESNLNEYYDIEFHLPPLAEPTLDKESARYSVSSGITVTCEHAAAVNETSSRLQYKAADGEYKDLYAQSTGANKLLFAGADVGEYDVRYVVTETVNFDGKTHIVTRYSPSKHCAVTKATLDKPSFDGLSVVYGESVGQIAGRLKALVTDEKMISDGGHFVPSGAQTDAAFVGVGDVAAVMPSARDTSYTVFFDYVSKSGNYINVTDIPVQVTVQKREVYVYISDAFSLVGEDLVPLESVEFYVDATKLADGDKISDLGISLYYSDDVNKDVASNSYRIYAACSNTNYTVVSRNRHSVFVDGGRYVVYPKEVEITADDGRKFVVSSDEGFANFKTAKVEIVATEGVKAYDGARAIAAYKVVLTDNYGNVVEPKEPYFVAWTNAPSGAKWIAVEGENALLDLEALGGVLKFDTATNVIAFYGEPPVERFEWTAVTIALLTVATMLACAAVALALTLILKRRPLK